MRVRVPQQTQRLPLYVAPLRETLMAVVQRVVPEAVLKRTPNLDDVPPEQREALVRAWAQLVRGKH